MAAGLWTQKETFDGTYDVGDLLDALEFLDVRDENKRRQAIHEQASKEN